MYRLCASIFMFLLLAGCSAPFQKACIKIQDTQSNFIRPQVKTAIDGTWDSNSRWGQIRIENGVIYDLNKHTEECFNTVYGMGIEEQSPGTFYLKVRYLIREIENFVFDRPATIQIADTNTLLLKEEAHSGMSKRYIILTATKISHPDLYQSHLAATLNKSKALDTIKCIKKIESCNDECSKRCGHTYGAINNLANPYGAAMHNAYISCCQACAGQCYIDCEYPSL